MSSVATFPTPACHVGTVTAVDDLAPGTRAIALAVDAGTAFRFREGQYIRIALSGGRRRDLSIASPDRGDGRIGLWLRDVGGDFSRQVFDALEPGDRWSFEGPLGDAWVREDDPRPLLLVTGGTGLGPARAIILALRRRGVRRRIELIHGDGDLRTLVPLDELWAVADSDAALTLQPTLQVADPGWSGATGTPDQVVAQRHGDLRGWCAHLFGPPPMVDAVIPVLRDRGIAAADIHADAFPPGALDLDPASGSR